MLVVVQIGNDCQKVSILVVLVVVGITIDAIKLVP